MKNLKKVLALVVVFTMVLSSVAFASYPDVDATADYAGAVELLSALSILKGDDTGNFNPDQNITRAEFAAVVCRALDLEGSANGAKGATDFTDVAADHWASGYINLASQQNIINGMGDGTFAPESDVTYTQAVKMLVVALGYEPMAEKKGGYPAGYLATANSIGLTEGVPSTASDVAALRSTVAMLTANAMELPTMEQHTYGTDSLFGVNDGKGDYAFKSLLTNMDIYIATGVVEPFDINSPSEIGVKISEESEDGMFTQYEKDGKTLKTKADFFEINDSNIADYAMQTVNVYVECVKSDKKVVAVVPADEGTATEIDISLIEYDKLTSDLGDRYVQYYQTADSTKTSKMFVENKDIPVYVNGAKGTDLATELNKHKNEDATVKFIENGGNKYCDTVEITVYKYYAVKSVDAAKDRIEFKKSTTSKVTFTDVLDDEAYKIAFKDAEGNDIEIADFAEGDVVAVVAKNPSSIKPESGNEIITYYNLGESLVNGTVTSLNDEAKTIYIDGTPYDVIYKTVNSDKGFKLGDEGAYYLTKTGKVFDFDGTLSKNYKVAYVLDAHYNKDGIGANTLQFQLLTADQGVIVVDATSTFTAPVFGKVELKAKGKEIAEKYDDAKIATGKADRLVKYKLNADNYLKEIEAFGDTANVGSTYNKDFAKIGKNYVAEETKIFVINDTNLTESYVTTVSALNEENTYNGIVADKDDDNVYALAVFNAADMSGIDKAQNIAVVASTADTTYEGEEAKVVTVYSDNSEEAKTLYFNDKAKNAGDANFEDDKIKAGSVILYTADENGLVSNYIVLATYDDTKSVLVPVSKGIDAAKGTTADKTEYSYAYGFIKDIKNDVITLAYGDFDNDGEVDEYKARGNMYTFEYKARGSKVTVDDYAAGNVDEYDTVKNTANFVFIKLADGNVTDIVTISNRAPYTNSIKTQAVEVVEEVVEEVVVDEDIVEVEIED